MSELRIRGGRFGCPLKLVAVVVIFSTLLDCCVERCASGNIMGSASSAEAWLFLVESMVSILILTKNEEANLPGCLASVSWSDDIHVLDSGSIDETVHIAKEAGARVAYREFDDWATHQNWAITNLPFKYGWVFCIDADERATAELSASIQEAAASRSEHAAFRFRRRDFLQGTWLKHVQQQPYSLRLFSANAVRFERLVHCNPKIAGSVGLLKGELDHFPFAKGYAHWIARHNVYSTLEAQQIERDRVNRVRCSVMRAIFTLDFHKRRFYQKQVFYQIPLRPIFKFVLLYVLRRGFLDGIAGFKYALLQSIYEFFIVLKVKEMSAGANYQTASSAGRLLRAYEIVGGA